MVDRITAWGSGGESLDAEAIFFKKTFLIILLFKFLFKMRF